MEFQVLGPVSARKEGLALRLGGPKQRLVLAIILAAHGDRVSTSSLIGNLWPDDAPASARKTLQVYVHHLRCEIGPMVETVSSGYALKIDWRQVDERLFGNEVAAARMQIETNPASAREKLGIALDRWHGSPYADFDDVSALKPEITRLTEERLSALGDRIDCDLSLGNSEQVIAELESLALRYPLRERFRAQEMLALYRSGRHADSLRAYSETRERLIEELGIEPSDSLTDLEFRILSHDSSLEPSVETLAFPEHERRGYQLVKRVRKSDVDEIYLAFQPSVGRHVAIRVIGSELALDPRFMERYRSDAAALAGANHPNIVYVQDTWLDDGKVFEVMAWIEGQRLDHYLRSGPIAPSAAWRIYEQVAGAAHAAHEVGVTHGAISMESVMVTRGANAHLKDFIGWKQSSVTEDRCALADLAAEFLRSVQPSETFNSAIAKLAQAAENPLSAR